MKDDVEVNLDAQTSSGQVKTDFSVTTTGNISKRHLRGTINGGGPEMYLRTSGGNIKVYKM